MRHEVDLQTFATLTEQDLREIGIQTFGARKKLLLLANSKSHFVLLRIHMYDIIRIFSVQKFAFLASLLLCVSLFDCIKSMIDFWYIN